MKKEWFTLKNISIALVVIVIGYFLVSLKLENNRLLAQLVTIQNKLAETDSLRGVLLIDTKILNERYAKIQDDYSLILNKNKALKKYIEDRDAKILALTTQVTQLLIENQHISGIVIKDSASTIVLGFDTTSQHYSIENTVSFSTDSSRKIVKNSVTQTIVSLSIPDSSYIGLIEQGNGILSGFIVHSNPYLHDTAGEFFIDMAKYTKPSPNWWLLGGVSAGAVILSYFVGAANGR
jgi:hypothetical protein